MYIRYVKLKFGVFFFKIYYESCFYIFVLHIYLFMLYHARINFFYAFQVILLANLEQPELWSLDSFGKWCLDNENLCGEKSKIIEYMKKGTLKIYSLIKIYE